MNKLLLLVSISAITLSAMESEEQKQQRLIQKYETHATTGWAAETIAFMKDPKNAENTDAQKLKRFIIAFGYQAEDYQRPGRYGGTSTFEQALVETLQRSPNSLGALAYIEDGRWSGCEAVCDYPAVWKKMLAKIEATIKTKSN